MSFKVKIIKGYDNSYHSVLNYSKIGIYHPNSIIIKLYDDKKWIGQIMIEDNWVFNFSINPKYRGLGLGTKLLKKAENKILKNGYDEVYLYPQKEFKKILVSWYKSLGYKKTDPHKDYVTTSDVLKKSLKESVIDWEGLSQEFEEEDKELQENWIMVTTQYEDVFGKYTKDIVNLSKNVHFHEGLISSEKSKYKVMLGRTYLLNKSENPLVEISTLVNDFNDEDYWNVLLHEMCHVASYYKYEDLDSNHNKGWKKFAEKINKFRKNSKLTPEASIEDFKLIT